MDKTSLNELNKKLEVIIALLLRLVPEEQQGLNLKEQISLLDNLKIRPVEIAEIIGRNPGYVNKELVAIRKKKVK